MNDDNPALPGGAIPSEPILMDLHEQAFFIGLSAADAASGATERIGAGMDFKDGTARRELAAFFWMTVGVSMARDLSRLMADASSEWPEERVLDVQQAFLRGALTRAPAWLSPAFELAIPTFDVPPFTSADGTPVSPAERCRHLVTALQRTWGLLADGDSHGTVHLTDPATGAWVPVGTFRVTDGW